MWFLNKKKEQDPNSVSRVAAGMDIRSGEIRTKGDMRLDGCHNGTIISDARIIIGESGKVKGTIICNNLDIWGNFTGTAYARETVSLKDGSYVLGKINAGRLVVENGSRIEGNARMISEEEFGKARL